MIMLERKGDRPEIGGFSPTKIGEISTNEFDHFHAEVESLPQPGQIPQKSRRIFPRTSWFAVWFC